MFVMENFSVPERFVPKDYRQCSLTVMDNIADPNIRFDSNGVSNYVPDYQLRECNEVFVGEDGKHRLDTQVAEIKRVGKGRKYDCILGVSGGVDSTYVAYLAKQLGLRVLCVHFDNGWNSELAVQNIENTVSSCGFDLYTHVFDWEQFKDLQLAHIKANVVDIESITDIAIFGTLLMLAMRMNIKYMLSGVNVVTEAILPKHWVFKDYYNIRDIHRQLGTLKRITAFPYWDNELLRLRAKLKGIRHFTPLNYIPYIKGDVKDVIMKEMGWSDYGGKHYESVFTRFYQGYILPNKFGIDKRKAHLSTLIASGQITKREALEELKQPILDKAKLQLDYDFVLKKLGYTADEFERYIKEPRREHTEFMTQDDFFRQSPIKKFVRGLFAK